MAKTTEPPLYMNELPTRRDWILGFIVLFCGFLFGMGAGLMICYADHAGCVVQTLLERGP